MAKQSALNTDYTNNADGFSIAGGTIPRQLTLSTGDVSIVGGGSAVVTFPTTTSILATTGTAGADIQVNSVNSDYTLPSSAIAAVTSIGATVYVADGTYTETTPIIIHGHSTRINFSGGATISASGALSGGLLTSSATGYGRTQIDGGKFVDATPGTNVGLDLDDMPNTWVKNMRIQDFNTGILMGDTASTTFYSHVENMQLFDCINGINLGISQPNLNLWTNVRIRPTAGEAGIGIYMEDVRGNVFNMVDVEPSVGTGISGIVIDGQSRDNLFLGMWVENNDYGLQIASGANNNVFIGGSITSSLTTDILDLGTNTTMIGVNKTGTKIYRLPKLTDIQGLEILKFTETASAVNEITIANAATAGKPTISATGDDSNISLVLASKGTGSVEINNASTGASLKITPTGNASSSTSVGGAILLTNTNNTGAGMVIYSNAGASSGRLLVVRADNTAFDQGVVYIENDGTNDALTVVGTASGSNAISATNAGVDHTLAVSYTGSTANKGAASFSSTNGYTTVSITDVSTGQGALKITHTGTGADGNASCLSLDIAGSGTAAQGIFMDSTGTTTGKLLNLRNNGADMLTLSAAGVLTVTGNITPTASDGAALGTTALMFSDLFLASGSVINFNNGDATITHSADLLAVAGATLRTNDLQLTTGSGIRTGTTAGNTFLLQARDVDGASYTTFATMTANDTPTFDIQPTSLTVNGNKIIISTAQTPASAAATGTTGTIAWDTGFLYVCTATDTWKRVAIATW